MVHLLLGLNLFDPALRYEPAIDLLNCLEAQAEVLFAFLTVARVKRNESFWRTATTLSATVASTETSVRVALSDSRVGPSALGTGCERIGNARNPRLNSDWYLTCETRAEFDGRRGVCSQTVWHSLC